MPDGLVLRPRLLDRLNLRRERRLVTVVAGAGFGKTALLVSAMAAGRAGPTTVGRGDVWLACEPADGDGAHLERGLLAAFGLPAGAGLPALCDTVWAAAPESVCLVLDDVHEIPNGSAGAALLGELLVELPSNGHVVLASREPVPVPTARLAASQQLVRLEED